MKFNTTLLGIVLIVSGIACQRLNTEQDISSIGAGISWIDTKEHNRQIVVSHSSQKLEKVGAMYWQSYLGALQNFQPNDIEIITVSINEKSTDGTCSLEIEYPQIRGLENDEVELKVNQQLEDLFLEPAAAPHIGFIRPFDLEHCAEVQKEKGSDDSVYQVQGDYTIHFNSAGILSVSDYFYVTQFALMARPSQDIIVSTIDLNSGKVLECEDFFKLDVDSILKAEQFINWYFFPDDSDKCYLDFYISEDGLLLYTEMLGYVKESRVFDLYKAGVINPKGALSFLFPPEQ